MKQFRLLLLLALLMTAATGAWGMQIYISYPSWPTGTNVNGDGNLVLEMEASDSFENMKAKIEDKSGLNPDYMKLYFNSVEMANNETLNAKGVTSNSVLTLVYTPPYSVTMKSGVKDADKWTVKVGEGQAQALPIGGLKGDGTETVTLQYNGRLKVKGVKATSDAAPAAKPAATVTTAPTATTGDIVAGSETALVSGGTATGGTMYYKETTANTKPTSTEGFSATVPTAKTLAAGTFYVWYYVKADDSHSDSEISASGIEVTIAAAAPATVLSGALVDGATIKVNFKWRGTNEGDYVQGVYNAASGTFTASKGGSYWGDDERAVYKVEKSGDNIIIGAGYYDYTFESMVWTFNTTNDTYTTTNGDVVNDEPGEYGLISVTLNGTDITSQLTAQ